MKTRFNVLACALLSVVFLTSCEKDDDLHVSDVPGVVMDSFVAKFPNASRTEWEKKGNYVVADFWQDGMELTVWYASDGEWLMTEYDLGVNLSALPQTVQTALQNGQYGTWRVDDIDKFERSNDVFYLIDVETQGQQDRNLYFAPDGQLLKDEVDKEDNDITPDIVF